MKKRSAQEEEILLDFTPSPKREPLIRRAIRSAADSLTRRPTPEEEAAYEQAQRMRWSNGMVDRRNGDRKREEEEE